MYVSKSLQEVAPQTVEIQPGSQPLWLDVEEELILQSTENVSVLLLVPCVRGRGECVHLQEDNSA